MRIKREFLENLIAELIARFLIGAVVAVLVLFASVRYFPAQILDMGWYAFAIPLAAGAIAALLGVRKGPGVI
jgi:uncharacterized membrane protein YbjE (DUF340 family)